MTELAVKLRMERARLNLTIGALAEAAGISHALLSGLEQGKGNPTLSTLTGLSVALGVPISYLIEDEAKQQGLTP